ncbi:MAG TPA: DUF2304 domain-containing protein [bacterium]|nr:DUF2304 domain-containing protein [bacterium]
METASGFSPFQLITVLFCAAMILRVASLWRRGRRTSRELIGWIFVWGGIGFVGAWPHAADVVGAWLGIKSGANTVVFLALILIGYVAIRSVFLLENLEQKLSELTRRLALKDFPDDERPGQK